MGTVEKKRTIPSGKIKAALLGCIYFSTLFSFIRIGGRLSLITLFTAAFCFYVFMEQIYRKKWTVSTKNADTRATLYLIFLTWISCLWSVFPGITVARNYAYTILPVYFLFVKKAGIEERDAQLIDKLIVFSGFAFFLYAVAAKGFSGVLSGRFAITEDLDENATCAALFLVLTVTTKNLIIRVKAHQRSAYYIVTLLMVTFLFLLTGSRGGLLALITWLFIAVIWNRRGRLFRIILITVFFVFAVFVIAPVILPESVYARLFSKSSYISAVSSDKNRVAIWRYCFEALIPGIKPYGYGAGVPPYLIGSYFGRVTRGIHNTYLCCFLEYGVFGLPALLVLLLSIIKRNYSDRNWTCLGMMVGIVIIAFFLESYSRTYFWNVLTYCSINTLHPAAGVNGLTMNKGTL